MMNPPSAHLTRRQALGALAAVAAGSSVLSQAAALPRIAIIGAGMAGVACAWLLDGANDVLLFEAAPSIGGNVKYVDVAVDGHSYRVDLGAQYFQPGPYPTYVALLEQLGLYPPATGGSHAFPASITLGAASEPTPRFVSPVLPGRTWPLLAGWNRDGLQAFNTAFAAAQKREQRDASWALTLGEWLPTLGLTPAQWEGMLLPWAASLHHGDITAAADISARAAMVFAAKALPDRRTDPILYNVLEGGMIEALNQMAAQFSTVQTHTGSPVTAVTRAPQGGFVIHTAAGAVSSADQVVLASSGEPTLALLSGLTGAAAQRAALQGIEFFDTTIMLHTDPAYAPAEARYRSFLNCDVQGAYCEASMNLAEVLTPAPGAPSPPGLWKSWVSHRAPPSQVLAEARFRHLLPSPRSIRSQRMLQGLQGQGGLWFAGGWTRPYDSQETALLSAMGVVDAMGTTARRSGHGISR